MDVLRYLFLARASETDPQMIRAIDFAILRFKVRHSPDLRAALANALLIADILTEENVQNLLCNQPMADHTAAQMILDYPGLSPQSRKPLRAGHLES